MKLWHLFTGYDETYDLFAHVMISDTEKTADTLLKHERTGATTRIRDYTFNVPVGGIELHMTYRQTFDHDPIEEELDEFRPVGHKSTDQDNDELFTSDSDGYEGYPNDDPDGDEDDGDWR